MERTFRVVNKGLQGKTEDPVVKLKCDDKSKLELHLNNRHLLDDYEIDDVIQVKIVREQTTLG